MYQKMNQEQIHTHHYPGSYRDPVAWRTILAGVIFTVFAQIMFNMAGNAFGILSLIPVYRGIWISSGYSSMGTVWTLITTMLSAFCGGYLIGRFLRRTSIETTGYNALMAWVVTVLLFMLIINNSSGSLMMGTVHSISHTEFDDLKQVSQMAAMLTFIIVIGGAVFAYLGGRLGNCATFTKAVDPEPQTRPMMTKSTRSKGSSK